jgi:hypothetical protein
VDERPGDDGRVLLKEERLEAGRVVWRLLKQDGGWVDEVFIGWPKLSPRYRHAGVDELESRGLLDRKQNGKGRWQVRLMPKPVPRQLSLMEGGHDE